jgi:hypothetical protein
MITQSVQLFLHLHCFASNLNMVTWSVTGNMVGDNVALVESDVYVRLHVCMQFLHYSNLHKKCDFPSS